MSVTGFSQLSTNNATVNNRSILDNNFIVTVPLPGTATTNNSNSLNLQTALPYATTETINVGVVWAASANGNNVNTTAILQHTNANTDGTNNAAGWANIPTLSLTNIVQTTVVAAGRITYRLPPACKQFIRLQVTSPANTGNVADSTATLELEF